MEGTEVSRQPYILTVRGKTRAYDFDIWEDPDNIEEWLEEDLLIVGPVLNSVPQWAQQLGLTKIYFWLQDQGVLRI